MQGGADLVHSGQIVDAHQVEAEAIDVVFIDPVLQGFTDVLTHHGPLTGDLVAAAAGVAVGTILIEAVEIVRDEQLEVTVVGPSGMVVDYVHDHADAGPVQGLYHLLELPDAPGAVRRVGGVTSLRYVVIMGVVTPVVLRGIREGLVHAHVIETGKQMDVGDAEFDEVIQPGSIPGGGGGAALGQSQKFPFVRDAGRLVHAKVAHMELVEHGIGGRSEGRAAVLRPPFRVGGQ